MQPPINTAFQMMTDAATGIDPISADQPDRGAYSTSALVIDATGVNQREPLAAPARRYTRRTRIPAPWASNRSR